MSKGEADTPNQHKISMAAHQNGTSTDNNDDHASSSTDNNNLYMTSASNVDGLNAGAKFVLESKGTTLLYMPQVLHCQLELHSCFELCCNLAACSELGPLESLLSRNSRKCIHSRTAC
jgi:hypothetical protein